MSRPRANSACHVVALTFTLALTLVILLCTFASTLAHADGGIPRANSILIEPGNPKDILVRSDFWGLFRSMDGGKTWQYGCTELVGGHSKAASPLNALLIRGGRVLVAGAFSGLRYSDDFCNWQTASSLGKHVMEDVQVRGADLIALSADGVDNGVMSRLWRSTDHGDSWTELGKPIPENFSGHSFGVAASDPQRIYVVGTEIATQHAAVVSSTDGGQSWQLHDVSAPSGDWTARFRGIDPQQPDVVFIVIDTDSEIVSQPSPDEVWATTDGGSSWNQVFLGRGDLPGFAFAPDAMTVMISGPQDGLQSANMHDALTKKQSAFHQVFDAEVWGLTWNDAGLYAGHSDFRAAGLPRFTLGVSHDRGATFSPLMTVCQVAFTSCAATSTAETSCRVPFSGPGGYETDYLQSERCTASLQPDAGTDAAAGKPSHSSGSSHGCSCSCVLGGDHTTSLLAAAWLLALLVSQRMHTRAARLRRG